MPTRVRASKGALVMVTLVALGCAWSPDADSAADLAIGTPWTLATMDPAGVAIEHQNLPLRLPGMQVAVGVREIREPGPVVAVFTLPPGSTDQARVVDALVASFVELNPSYEPKVESVAGQAVTLVAESTGEHNAALAVFQLGDAVYEVRRGPIYLDMIQSLIEANR